MDLGTESVIVKDRDNAGVNLGDDAAGSQLGGVKGETDSETLGGKAHDMEEVRLNVSHADLMATIIKLDGVAMKVSSQTLNPQMGLNKIKELSLKDISNKLEAQPMNFKATRAPGKSTAGQQSKQSQSTNKMGLVVTGVVLSHPIGAQLPIQQRPTEPQLESVSFRRRPSGPIVSTPDRDRLENLREGDGSSQNVKDTEMVRETPLISKQFDVAMADSLVGKGDMDQVAATPQ